MFLSNPPRVQLGLENARSTTAGAPGSFLRVFFIVPPRSATNSGHSPLGPADGPHLPAPAASAEELIAAIGLEPRHHHSGRHFQPLQDLSRSRIDLPHIAHVTFPGAVPELSVDPGDPGDEAVGLDRAKNRPCVGIDLMDLPVPDTARPKVSLRPTRAPSHRRRRAPGSWRVHGRSADRSSGCDLRRAETGAGRRRPFLHARRRRSSAASSRSRDRRRSACLRQQTRRADRHT